MKTIVKYVATDGSEWDSQIKCTNRDLLDMQVRTLEKELGPSVHGSGQRRKIDAAAVARLKADVVDLCRRQFPGEAIFKHDAAEIHPFSYAGRFLSEVGGPLNRIWHRFMCMNSEWEYEQPFFALNPSEFKEDAVTDAVNVVQG